MFRISFIIRYLALCAISLYNIVDGNGNESKSTMPLISDCIACKLDQPDIKEYLKSQKVAQRLEYIKQQLISNLHIESPPKKPPKSNRVPDFLVEQLLNEQTEKPTMERIAVKDESRTSKQVVLFPEEDTNSCRTGLKNGVCLKFKLTEELLTIEIPSVSLWFNKELFFTNDTNFNNFTIVDTSSLNVKHRHKRHRQYRLQENDGWYQHEIGHLIKTWQNSKEPKTRTLMITCESCPQVAVKNERESVNDSKTPPFLLLTTETEKNSRTKRGVDCLPGNNECCRENLEVDFQDLGDFSMIIHPTKFNAYICRGACFYHSATSSQKPYASLLVKLKLNNATNYALPTSCCTPTKFSDLKVMYANDNQTYAFATIPNIIVESCDHPNCRLFVTHGGLHSLLESVNASVPIVGLPFFSDQPYNMALVEYYEIGLALQSDEIETNLLNAVREVLKNPKYKNNMKKRARMFNERLTSPLETAIYWVEHILKFKNSNHLTPASVRLRWYELFLLDVMAVYLAILSHSRYIQYNNSMRNNLQPKYFLKAFTKSKQ